MLFKKSNYHYKGIIMHETHILLGLLILAVIIVGYSLSDRCSIDSNMIEGMSVDETQIGMEALQNIASIYNNQNLATTNLNVTEQGTIKNGSIQNLSVSGSFNVLPPGSIIMFNGTKAPSGWALCDGQSGRPDLRNRFVLGYGGGKSIGAKGGAETHKLTAAQIPSHNHSYKDWYRKTEKVAAVQGGGNDIASNGATYSGRTTGSTGGNQAHNNMPPYYVLAYIIKL
jgi:microcystin-dependent protein